ncbi:hypothetical protein QM012_005459 [Aureobasidium pullulans]|uniref:GLEYA adhesin domain-containing protein n=1 Tax=Aureobasidium pullulans TaxID=5580 RepID=A0ABR0T4Q4_AURPU
MSVPNLNGHGKKVLVDGGDGRNGSNGDLLYYYPDDVSRYGGSDFNTNNFTFVWTGYFAHRESRSYQFCLTYAGNRQAFYIGNDAAFPCGDSSNAATPRGATTYDPRCLR